METWIVGIVILLLVAVFIKIIAGDGPVDSAVVPMIVMPTMFGNTRGSSGSAAGVVAVILLIILVLAIVALPGV